MRQGDSALVAIGFERIAAASAEIRQCHLDGVDRRTPAGKRDCGF